MAIRSWNIKSLTHYGRLLVASFLLSCLSLRHLHVDGGRGTMTRFLQTTQGISNNRFSSLLDLGVFRRGEEAKKALQMETVRVYKSKSRKRVYFGTMSLNQTQMMVECCSCSPCISIIFAMKPLGSTALSHVLYVLHVLSSTSPIYVLHSTSSTSTSIYWIILDITVPTSSTCCPSRPVRYVLYVFWVLHIAPSIRLWRPIRPTHPSPLSLLCTSFPPSFVSFVLLLPDSLTSSASMTSVPLSSICLLRILSLEPSCCFALLNILHVPCPMSCAFAINVT